MPRIRVTRSAERVDRPTADFDAYPQPGVIAADASTSSPLFVTLPSAALMRGGEITVVNIGASGTVIVDTTGADTINGSGTYTLATQYDAVTVESLGGAPGWVISTGGGGGGGGVTDHGALTGLGDDDHKLYEPTTTDFDVTGAYTVTTETRLIMAVGGTVTLPAGSTRIAAGARTLNVLAGTTDVTISTVSTDNVYNVGDTAYVLKAGSTVRLVPYDLGGFVLWIVGERAGASVDVPGWYDTTTGTLTVATGETVVMGATGPEWTVGATDGYHFLSGTGWTDNVPVLIPCKNTSGGSLSKGAPVYITGTVGSTAVIEVAAADSDDPTKMPAIGLLDTTLAVNDFGYVVTQGIISGVNTSAYTINAPLYVSTTAGQLTQTRPSTGIQPIARAGRINSSTGTLIVVGSGTTQNITAIDPIWDAAGDLAVGSGADTAARLAKGTRTQALVVGASTLEWDANHFSGGNFVTGTVANTIAETLPGATPFGAVAAPTTTGIAHLHGVYLPKGTVVTNLTVVSGSVAAGTPTNQWFALCNDSRQVLRYTVNDLTAAWNVNTPKTLGLTSTYTTTYSGLHYIAVVVTATTMPSFRGINVNAGTMTGISGQSFASSTGLTTPAAFGPEGTAFAAATSRIQIVMGIVS